MASQLSPKQMAPGTRARVKARSGGRCEAEMLTKGGWTRCPERATEVHHMLPKSRGGRHLDSVGETYHLIHLCLEDHRMAHSRGDAEGLMINGQVGWDKIQDRPTYEGDDEYLCERYGTRMGDGWVLAPD